MTAPPRLPRLSRLLLEWAARRLRTPDLADDAAELFLERAAADPVREARRWYRQQARAALGRVLIPRRRLRRTLLPRALAGLPLDAKLGLRMVVRYPGLTLVAVVAMAFAIFVGAGLFEFIDQTLPNSRLPLPQGERVVGLRYWDREANAVAPVGVDDLQRWRSELRTVELIGGFRTVSRNLFVGQNDGGGLVETAAMSPVGFRLTGQAPMLGRALDESDTASDAAPVVVLGYRLWQTRFGSDPDAVGRTVHLDDRRATVVGVMPEGFRFPISHSLWVPLNPDVDSAPAVSPVTGTNTSASRSGERQALDKMRVRTRSDGSRTVSVFGRLAEGATVEEARAELAAALARAAGEDPERLEHVTAQVLPYRESLFSRPITLMLRVIIMQMNAFAALFLMLVSANIALLLFARAATRERELLMRTALGASRGRIVSQLFVEALLLSVIATTIGLAGVGPGLRWLERQLMAMGGGTPPFWFQASVSASTACYAGMLAVLAAVIAGVVPALKATGQLKHARLGQVSAGGGGLRFGGIWTAVVVTQIAATVVFAGGALLMVQQARRSGAVDATFPAGQYLTMRVDLDTTMTAPATYRDRLREFEAGLAAQPGVAGVTVARRLPLMIHPTERIELEGAGMPSGEVVGLSEVATAVVDVDFFDVFRTPILAGRGFVAADLLPDADAVIVDDYFVDAVLGGRPAVGRRIRGLEGSELLASEPWHTIVGVVRSLESDRPGALDMADSPRPFVYQPLPSDATGPLQLAAHVPAGPDALAAAVQRIAVETSPAFRLDDVQPLERIAHGEVAFWRLWADLILLVGAVALFLSLAGIYAVMSFIVSRRTREIGIRIALGAPPIRVVAQVLRAAIAQVCVGVIAGSVLVAVLMWSAGVALSAATWIVVLGAALLVVCALAGIAPARRALRVEPTRALAAPE